MDACSILLDYISKKIVMDIDTYMSLQFGDNTRLWTTCTVSLRSSIFDSFFDTLVT